MSARQLQRLEKSLTKRPVSKPASKSDEDDEEQVQEQDEIATSKARSAFMKLAISDDDDDDDQDGETNKEPNAKSPDREKQIESSKPKSKKKNKKKHHKQDNPQNARKAEASHKNDEDKLLDELVAKQAQETLRGESAVKQRFAFDPSRLDADREVRRKLGRALASSASASSSTARRPKPPGGGRVILPPGISAVQTTSIPRVLVTPDSEWFNPPTFASGTGAHMVRTEDDVNTFTFEASSAYKQTQEFYRTIVKTYDPQEIVNMVQTHPFHVDALLQLFEVFASSGQNETAQVMLRRSIFTLESWCSPAFRSQLGSGSARLKLRSSAERAGRNRRNDIGDEDEDEMLHDDGGIDCGLNGAFLRAVALAMKTAGRRDCYETAFNLCKMLLSLSPEIDPCHALLSVDYYAIKAKDYDFVLSTHDIREQNWLPICCLARVVALFHKTRLPNSDLNRSLADEALETLVLNFPRLVVLILEANQRSVPEWIGARANYSHANFELIDRLCHLAFTRLQTLVNNDDFLGWMSQAISMQIRVRGLPRDSQSDDFSVLHIQDTTSKWLKKYARCRLVDLSDKIDLIPREELARDEMNRLDFMGQPGNHRGLGEDDQEEAPRRNVDLRLNDLMLFLQTMLPWVRVARDNNDGGNAENDDVAEVEWDVNSDIEDAD